MAVLQGEQREDCGERVITEADIKRMEEIMQEATEALRKEKGRSAVLVKMYLDLHKKYQMLREWSAGFQS